MNFVFEINCDLWVQKLVIYKFLLILNIVQSIQLFIINFDIYSKVKNVTEIIQIIKSLFILIDYYFDILYKFEKKKKKKNLNFFYKKKNILYFL